MVDYNCTVVFFDLETTGLDIGRCHIIQLSAVCEGKVFNRFVLPLVPIDKEATRKNGFTKHNFDLYRHGNHIETTGLYRTLKSFIAFLSSFDGPVLLAAHNAWRFDAVILARVLHKCHHWKKFKDVVSGFLDTLPLFQSLYPGLYSYSLPNLAKYFQLDYRAHDAVEDATMLERLFDLLDPDEWDILEFVRPC